MQYSWWTLLIICPLVFLGGLVDAIAGGGGLIALPAYLLAGFTPYNAIATNKLSSSIGTSVSTARMIRNRCIDVPLAIPTVVISILGAMLGSKLCLLVDENIIRYLLLLVLPVVAFIVMREKNLDTLETETIARRKQFVIVLLAAFGCAIYDGFYGPGAGTFMLLAFTKLGKMDLRNASGNVKVANLSSNIGSLVVFLLNGQAVIPIGLAASVFGIAGHYIGAGLLLKNGSKVVRPIILCVIALLFARVIYDLVA